MISVSSLGSLAAQSPGFDRVLVLRTLWRGYRPQYRRFGFLSSMLWLVLLRQRGLDIRPLQFLKLGLLVAPPMLIIGVTQFIRRRKAVGVEKGERNG
jgi:arsenical pump membrane protein